MHISTNMYDLDDFSEKVTTVDSAHSTPHSTTNLHGDDLIVTDAEFRKLIWKLDWHLLPPLFLLYFVSLIDRVNIGNARLQGLESDLGMVGNQFNTALCIIFIGLILFEVPSNLLVKRISPSIVLTSECFLLGIFTIGQGLVKTFAGFTAMRFFIGIMEAGLIPGSCFLLAAYYPRYELQWRINILMVGNAISSAFGGLIALAVAGIKTSNGYSGWRWIFIIEGAVTAFISAAVYFVMSDWPETAKWLSDAEKAVLGERIRQDGMVGRMDKLDRKAVIRCVTDWKIWICSIMTTCAVLSLYSINLFSPSIIKLLNPNSTAAHVQGLTIPIFIVSGFFSLLAAYLSDRLHHRSSFAILGFVITLSGLIIMLYQDRVTLSVRYVALYLISTGAYISVPALWLLLVNNCSGRWKVAIAIAMQTGVGNFGGIASALCFLSTQAPDYTMGWRVSTGLTALALVLAIVYVVGLWWENTCREVGERDSRLDGEDKDNLGDDHPRFRYTY